MTARRGAAPAKPAEEPKFTLVYQAITEYDYAEIAAALPAVVSRSKKSASLRELIAAVLVECDARQKTAVSQICEAAFATGANMTPTDATEREEWQVRALQARLDTQEREQRRAARLEREASTQRQKAQRILMQAAIPTQLRARTLCERMAQATTH